LNLAEINWHSFFFLIFALVTCLAAVAVVFTVNVVRMAVYLIVSLLGASGLFFLAGADFVGAMQLMIYVGGTLVLLIFGVMLTAQGPFVSMKTKGGEWITSAVVGAALLVVLLQVAVSVPDWNSPPAKAEAVETAGTTAATMPARTATPIGMALLGARVDRPQAPGYLLPFEIVSVHLLVVLIGAAYLARSKKRLGGPGMAE
jgi:NADH-quinone oxidoreductase subunit J